jgi:hypothetical protein
MPTRRDRRFTLRVSFLPLSTLRIAVVAFALIALVLAAIGCEKTVYEPGESEHGGVFLHGTPSSTAP